MSNQYIRHLSFVEGYVLLQEWADETLSKLSTHLSSHLTSLALVEVSFVKDSDLFEDTSLRTFAELQRSPDGYKSITTLTIRFPYYFNDLIDFIEILCSFPLLEELNVQTGTLCGSVVHGWDRRTQYNLPSSIIRLTLRVLDDNLLQWFLRQPNLLHVQQLELVCAVRTRGKV